MKAKFQEFVRDKKVFLKWSEFIGLCDMEWDMGVAEAREALVRMQQWGILLHLQSSRGAFEDMVVLDTDWLSKTIVRLLRTRHHNEGVLHKPLLADGRLTHIDVNKIFLFLDEESVKKKLGLARGSKTVNQGATHHP